MINFSYYSLDKMIVDSESTHPDECCGFMFGHETDGIRFVTDARPVVNVKEGDRRRRFIISPKDYMLAEKFAEDHGLLLLGIYHSHPEHPAIPSEHDRLSAQPYFSYAIISVINKKFAGIRSWLLNDDSIFEEELITEKEHNTKN